jgi:adhesin/invasin
MRMSSPPVRRFGNVVVMTAVVVGGAWTLGCGSSNESTTTDTYVISAVTATSQDGTVGQGAAAAPTVLVTKNGSPDPGVTVAFAITDGIGSISGANQNTGADGVARSGVWTLGTTAGSNAVTATASIPGIATIVGNPVLFNATGAAGPAVALVKAAGDSQTSAAGLPVATRPAVKVTDSFGNPVNAVNVAFAAGTGGGSITGASQITGANGVATVGSWTLGQLAGTNTLTATSTGLAGSPQTFTATGVAGPVASLVKAAGDSQTAVVGTSVLIAPAVKAADQFGNLIANQSVAFAVATGGGSVTGASPTTGVNGIATLGSWTLGPTAGTNTLSATASTFTVVFTATGSNTASFNAAPYAGTYHGTWTNTTFSSTGTANAVVTVNTATNTASVTVNVTGSVLGTGSGVSNVVENGAYTANGVTFSANVPPMGNMTVNGVAGASSVAVTASGVNVPNAAITRWDASGTLTPSALQLNFTVTFASGPPASGTISLVKP